MTEYEQGFLEACRSRGLTDRQAGGLCKMAYFFFGNDARQEGMDEADGDFMSSMTGSDGKFDQGQWERYQRYVNSRNRGLGQWFRRNWNNLIHSSDYIREQEQERREAMQAEFQNKEDARNARMKANRERNMRRQGLKPDYTGGLTATPQNPGQTGQPPPPSGPTTASGPYPANMTPTSGGLRFVNGRPIFT